MRLTSPAFTNGEAIPRQYTQDGEGVSPPLNWTAVPSGTRSLALVVEDPDAPDPDAPTGTFVHWVVADIPADLTGLSEDARRLPAGCVGLNDYGHAQWDGPKPPIGRHRYTFKLYALDRMLELVQPSKADLEEAMQGHVLAETKLVGTYQSPRDRTLPADPTRP